MEGLNVVINEYNVSNNPMKIKLKRGFLGHNNNIPTHVVIES